MDGISFEYVRLTFNKRKLNAISVQTKNNGGSSFLEKLTRTYGDIKPSKTAKNKQWKNSKMNLVYETSGNGREAVVSFYSNMF